MVLTASARGDFQSRNHSAIIDDVVLGTAPARVSLRTAVSWHSLAAVRLTHTARESGAPLDREWPSEQAGSGGAWHQRSHAPNSSKPDYAEDGGGVVRRSRSNGRPDANPDRAPEAAMTWPIPHALWWPSLTTTIESSRPSPICWRQPATMYACTRQPLRSAKVACPTSIV